MHLTARVKPGSKQPGISVEDGALVVRVRERAMEGAANEACVRALAQALDVAPSCVTLVQGARSRQKRFSIAGMDESAVRQRLGLGV